MDNPNLSDEAPYGDSDYTQEPIDWDEEDRI